LAIQSSTKPKVSSPGIAAFARFLLEGQRAVVCEAKERLTREVMSQALVYRKLAQKAGAHVDRTVIFAARAPEWLKEIAEELVLEVVVA
jgi:hypothetical protein